MNQSKTILERIESLRKMPSHEWEAICKNCGICCLSKIEDDFGKIIYSPFSCKNFDLCTKKCKCYAKRLETKSCQKVTLDDVLLGRTVPDSCGYVEYIFGPAKHEAKINWKKVQNLASLSFDDYDKLFSSSLPHSIHWSSRYNFCTSEEE